MKKEIARIRNGVECIENDPYDGKLAKKVYDKVMSELENGIRKSEDKIIEILKGI